MKSITRIGVGAALAAVLAASGAAAANASTPPAASVHPRSFGNHSVGTVYAQTDGLGANSVVVFDRLADGTLHQTGTYATGGVGVQLGGSVADHLASQGSLAEDGGSLFAVNGGSDTVTSFARLGDRLYRGQVVGSGGQAPVSIAAHGSRVFVLNARGGGSIQGYVNIAGHLTLIPSWHRDLGLDPTATPEFTHTPAEIAFTPDGSKLIVSTKGDTSAFDVYAMSAFGPSRTAVVTTLPGEVPFGFQFDAAGHLIASEAGTNSVADFTVNADGTLTPLASQATGQAATCWILVVGDHVYASNAASSTLSGYQIGARGSLASIGLTPTDAGAVDAAASVDGRFVYVQAGVAGTVDEYRVTAGGELTRIGTVAVAVGAEGIVAN